MVNKNLNMDNNSHFNKIFWFIIFSFVYLTAVTFIQIPKENQQTVNIVTGAILGTVLTSGIGFLLGGSPNQAQNQPKKPITPDNLESVDKQ